MLRASPLKNHQGKQFHRGLNSRTLNAAFRGKESHRAAMMYLGDALALDGAAVALALQSEGSHQPLNLGRLAVLLAVLLLHCAVRVHIPAHHWWDS
jgi:hypothetical protein